MAHDGRRPFGVIPGAGQWVRQLERDALNNTGMKLSRMKPISKIVFRLISAIFGINQIPNPDAQNYRVDLPYRHSGIFSLVMPDHPCTKRDY